MNNKGFSLVELIAVISLLVVLALIVVPSVLVFINKSNENSYIELLNSIESAAKVYVAENRYSDTVLNNNEFTISLQTLIDNGNLDGDLTDPITKSNISSDNTVKVTFSSKIYIYTFDENICNKDEYTWLDSENKKKYKAYCLN